MGLTRWLVKLVVFGYCLIRYGSYKMAHALAFHNIALKQLRFISRKGDRIVFNKTGNAICISQLPVFSFSINNLVNLLQHPGVQVEEAHPGYFIANINGLRFNVSSLSNMAVLYEIFVEDIYKVDLLSNNLLVLDIGMNVGVASQYFALSPKVKAVYGYEPFPDTCREAIANIGMNETVRDKITCNEYGISNVTETREIPLFDSGLLSASTIGSDTNTYGRSGTKKLTVKLRAIDEVFDELFPKYPGCDVLLKIDCEGEEYPIFEKLDGTGYLDKVSCALIEWHEKGPGPIVAVLKKHQFQLLHIPHATANSGMIYAFKQALVKAE